MRVSVIIVSYNVYPFLDNCLRSVEQALTGIDGEIIVVDNASVDRTTTFVKEHFPQVRLIANTDNVGFAKANNQGIHISQGEYVLLLNPDTILSENTIKECLSYMDQQSNTGAVGVKMIDGGGRFLPESKRGFPTLRASFMKMTGLYHLFPRSSFMNSYYQGHLGENETGEIDVLCGAFMFIRSSTLITSGDLDEDFFMYGEDIDLSYRIRQTGQSIVYLPTTSIIHYKGESTRKSSLNYILTFYQAMLIFTKKHSEFKGQQFLIKVAIYLHGLVQFTKHTVSKWWPPLLDIILFAGSFFVVSKLWATYYFGDQHYFQDVFYYFNIPLYTLIIFLSLFICGAYDKPFTRKSSWLGFVWGMLGILVVYAILPTHLRTSRMVIVLGSLLFTFFLILTRWKISPWKLSGKDATHTEARKAIIVAGQQEANRIKELINRSHDLIDIVGIVSPGDIMKDSNIDILGPFSQLQDIIRVHQVKEVIYSAQDVPFSKFTGSMSETGPGIRSMLAASTTMNIVGSMSSQTEGESYAIRVDFNLSHAASKRAKRIFDVSLSVLLLLFSPILFFLVSPRNNFFQNLFLVLGGKKTWVSYHPDDPLLSSLPKIKYGILSPVYPVTEETATRRVSHIHYVYARDYHWTSDLSIIANRWHDLGQKPLVYA